MGRKRRLLSKRFGFQEGNSPQHKGKKLKYESEHESEPFMRFPHKVFESRVMQNNENVLEVLECDQSPCPPKLLRPRPKSPDPIDEYLETDVPDPDNHTYKHYVPSLVSVMWNATIKEHSIKKNECKGNLEFDSDASIKWGYGWKERLKCVKCDFVGNFYKLFHEVDNTKKGRKAATINMGIQAGLMTTAISNKSFREISLSSNVIPANLSGMQRLTNRVSSEMVTYNRQDMKDIRESLVEENEMVGYSNPHHVNVETDGRYNNPIFNSDVTPFQAGTQVVQTMVENNSKLKRIIGVYTGNKLCNIASRLRNKGIEIICPNHEGYCSANLSEDFAIGNEMEHSKHCTNEVNDALQIVNVTSDGDSKAANGIIKAQKGKVGMLRDVRHLASGIKRAVQNSSFSSTMFSGKNKRNHKHRFGMDLKARCVAELNQAFKTHKNEVYVIKQQMPKTIKAIIKCYQGNCGIACKLNSYVCTGLPGSRWEKSFLPSEERTCMSADDEFQVENCIKVLLGQKSLGLVRFLTSTQKCEAFNRTLQRCNPKTVTYSRNFPGRVHTAVHMNNHKFGNSTVLRTKVLGAALTAGSSVIKYLKQNQDLDSTKKKIKQSRASKSMRFKSRRRKYALHAAKNYAVHYRKGIADPKPSGQNHN